LKLQDAGCKPAPRWTRPSSAPCWSLPS